MKIIISCSPGDKEFFFFFIFFSFRKQTAAWSKPHKQPQRNFSETFSVLTDCSIERWGGWFDTVVRCRGSRSWPGEVTPGLQV